MIRFLGELSRLRRHIRIPWGHLAAGILLMSALSLLDGVSITMLAPIFDRVMSGQQFSLPDTMPDLARQALLPAVETINRLAPAVLLKYILALVFLLVSAKCLVAYANTCMVKRFALRTLTSLREKIFTRYLHAPLEEHRAGRIGDRISHFTYDTNILGAALGEALPGAVLNLMKALAYFALVMLINWRLTLVSLLVLPFLLLPVSRIGRALRNLSRQGQESVGTLNAIISAVLTNLPVIKSFVTESREEGAFSRNLEQFFQIAYRSARRRCLLAQISELVITFTGMALIYLGFREIQSGALSAGNFLVFLVALFSLFSPLKSIIVFGASLQQANAVFPRLDRVLASAGEPDPGREPLPGLEKGIIFEKVSFSHRRKARKVLDEVSFSLEKGRTVGIAGESGSGKTTIINLLLRFYRPSEGRILVDGRPAEGFRLADWRKLFGLVTQEPLLFNDTIAANIAYARPGAEPGQVSEAARVANIADYIESLPDGYETLVSERGESLSGGEKQRLALARAVLADPEVLILDEATSNLDSKAEKAVQEALERIIAGRTCLVIAHRLSTLRKCDTIIVLEKGRVVQRGTHRELVSREGPYRHLCALQGIRE